jgi:hypothetical protein
MLVYKDGQVKHYKEMFANVSFGSAGPTDDFLTANNAVKVNLFKEHDRATEKLVPCDPYIDNGWAYTVEVVAKTQEDIDAEIASKAAQMRSQRDAALKASDWTQVLDAPVDQAAWAAYRQALRDLPDADGFPNVDFPQSPIDNPI